MLSVYPIMIDNESSRNTLEQIYLLLRQTMVFAANRILHDQVLAEDATHAAFLRIINHFEKITEPNCNKTRSYIVLIVKYFAAKNYRKMNRRPEFRYDKLNFAIPDDFLNLDEIYQHIKMNNTS